MALRCLNCGETGLRDKAEFCDTCGQQLIVKLDDSIPLLNELQTEDNDSAANEAVEDGNTTAIRRQDDDGADGNTTAIRMQDDDGDGNTTAIRMQNDEGATSFLEEDTKDSLPEEGSTQLLARAEEGATSAISLQEGLPQFKAPAGETTLISENQGQTSLLSNSEEADPEGLTQAISDIPPQKQPLTKEAATKTTPRDYGTTGVVSLKVDENLDTVAEYKILEGNTQHPATKQKAGEDDGSTQFILTTDTQEPEVLANTSSWLDKQETDFDIKHVIRIQDRYQLSKILGKGGFGAVYLAEDIKLKRQCVVKQMLTFGKSPKEMEGHRANFEREASLLAELNTPGHPNIPEIYDFFIIDSGNYLVMKYIEGENLKEVLEHKEEGKLPWQEAVRYMIDVSSALHYMHTKGAEPVMHRDLKPANIQLGDDGRVWLVDFGLAKADPVEDSQDKLVTQASGSFGYTALEQWFGKALPASDVYSVGVTLHNLVTGLDPLNAYEGQFHIQKIQELHGQFPPIRTIDPQLPEQLEQIIIRATAADPEQRPTARQLQQQLEAIISGTQTTVLYTFKNGKSAKTVTELVNLCEKNRREAETYLYSGDFERWFLLINRNDLAEAAAQAVKQGKNRKEGLERFLKLILPNIFRRRLRRAGLHLARGTLQFALISIFVILLLGVGGSYVAGLFIRQFIGSVEWNFYALELDQENVYNETFLTDTFGQAAQPYFEDVKVEIQAPDIMNITGTWQDIPLDVSTRVRMGEKNPRVTLAEINDFPLFIIGDNISQGINNGIDEAFRKGPVDVSHLVVQDEKIVFEVEKTQEQDRPDYATPTPVPTPTPTPLPTPTPVNVTLVVVFNDSDTPLTLQIEALNQTWDIAAQDTQVLQTPPGTYTYTVKYQGTDTVAAEGSRTWTLNKAYRLRINLAETTEPQ